MRDFGIGCSQLIGARYYALIDRLFVCPLSTRTIAPPGRKILWPIASTLAKCNTRRAEEGKRNRLDLCIYGGRIVFGSARCMPLTSRVYVSTHENSCFRHLHPSVCSTTYRSSVQQKVSGRAVFPFCLLRVWRNFDACKVSYRMVRKSRGGLDEEISPVANEKIGGRTFWNSVCSRQY